MNKKAIVFAVAVAALTCGAASAQSYEYRGERNGGYERDAYSQPYSSDSRTQRDYRDGLVSEHLSYADRDDYRHSRRDRNDRWDRHDRHERWDRHDRHERYDHRPAHAYGYGNYSGGNGSYYQMRRGERLAAHYRDQRYVVRDWRGHRLHQPQYGYQWVQAGNDYALVAIATGLIAQVLLNH